MPPDLNSLPDSRVPMSLSAAQQLSERPRRISFNNTDTFRSSPPSPHSPALSSLQAAATINAGLHSGASPARSGMQRRRSSLLNNFSMNDPPVPAPGEIQHSNGSSRRNSPRIARRSFLSSSEDRHLSLGELHQELENEQEAQVNRLLHMIRLQQDQLAVLSRERSRSDTGVNGSAIEESPRTTPHPHNRPHSLSRQSSSRFSTAQTSSRGASPALRPASGSLGPLTEDFMLGGGRDENAFYQAETQMLTRENQMLKHRIRELERQISELSKSAQVLTPQSQPASPLNTTTTS